jgi:hypothetical protein
MRSVTMVAIVTVALSISGCAKLTNAYKTITEAKVPAQTLIVAANGFNAAKSVATTYINYCSPKPQPVGCSNDAIGKLIPAMRAGTKARDDIETFIDQHPGELGAQGLYDAVVAATNTINQIKQQYSIDAIPENK